MKRHRVIHRKSKDNHPQDNESDDEGDDNNVDSDSGESDNLDMTIEPFKDKMSIFHNNIFDIFTLALVEDI